MGFIPPEVDPRLNRERLIMQIAEQVERVGNRLLEGGLVDHFSPSELVEIGNALIVRRRLLDRVRHALTGTPRGLAAEKAFQVIDTLIKRIEAGSNAAN